MHLVAAMQGRGIRNDVRGDSPQRRKEREGMMVRENVFWDLPYRLCVLRASAVNLETGGLTP